MPLRPVPLSARAPSLSARAPLGGVPSAASLRPVALPLGGLESPPPIPNSPVGHSPKQFHALIQNFLRGPPYPYMLTRSSKRKMTLNVLRE